MGRKRPSELHSRLTIMVAEKQKSRYEFLAFHCPGSKWKEKRFAINECLIVKDGWTDNTRSEGEGDWGGPQ